MWCLMIGTGFNILRVVEHATYCPRGAALVLTDSVVSVCSSSRLFAAQNVVVLVVLLMLFSTEVGVAETHLRRRVNGRCMRSEQRGVKT